MNSAIPDDVLYLLHATNRPVSELVDKKLKVSPTCKGAHWNLQFPGVFMSVVTKFNRLIENRYSGKYYMIFPRDLLLQRNYHVNVHDHNGYVTENNTYFPWNLGDAVDAMRRSDPTVVGNEVVFHDDIPLKHLCRVVKAKDAESFFYGELLPKRRLFGKHPVDKKTLPFYVLDFESEYTGRKPPFAPSSVAWYRMLAKVSNIDVESLSKKEVIAKLAADTTRACTDRSSQNLQVLIDWTNKKKAKKTSKSTSESASPVKNNIKNKKTTRK